MSQSRFFSNVVMLSTLCVLMITFSPICTVSMLRVELDVLVAENELEVLIEDDFSTILSDEMPLRMAADLVYDSESDRVIFFGGAIETLQADYDDTWCYDFNTNEWTNMLPTTHPPASDWHQMTYHSGEDRVVLFGGHVSGSLFGPVNRSRIGCSRVYARIRMIMVSNARILPFTERALVTGPILEVCRAARSATLTVAVTADHPGLAGVQQLLEESPLVLLVGLLDL